VIRIGMTTWTRARSGRGPSAAGAGAWSDENGTGAMIVLDGWDLRCFPEPVSGTHPHTAWLVAAFKGVRMK
jgi:hypothetical protein